MADMKMCDRDKLARLMTERIDLLQGLNTSTEKMFRLTTHLVERGVTVRERGRWKERYPPIEMILTGEERLFVCSVCTAKYSEIEGKRFCPWCGAKME